MPPPVPSGNRRPSVPSVPQYDEEQENCKYHTPTPLVPYQDINLITLLLKVEGLS